MQGPKGEKLKAVQCGAKQTVLVTYDDEPVKGPGPGPGPQPPPKDEGEKGSWLVPGILAGVGVVGLGVGAGFHFAGVGTRDDATALQRPGACTDRGSAECTAISDKLDAASTQRTVSAVALIGGSAALGAAVVSLFVVRPWERRSRASVQGLVLPTFAPGYAGASFTRSF